MHWPRGPRKTPYRNEASSNFFTQYIYITKSDCAIIEVKPTGNTFAKYCFSFLLLQKRCHIFKKMRKKNRKENVKKSQIAINSLPNKLPSGSPICNSSVQPLHLYLFLCLENAYKWMNLRVVYTLCFFSVFLQLAFFLRQRYLIAIRSVSIFTILINEIWVELFRQVLHWIVHFAALFLTQDTLFHYLDSCCKIPNISFADIFSIYIFLLIRSSVDNDDDECEYIYSAQYTVPWVPQTFLARFPVSVKSL